MPLRIHSAGFIIHLIDRNPDEHFAEECAALGACVIAGDASEISVLNQARVACAKEAVVITPEDETNVRIATEIRRLSIENKSKLPKCFVHLENIHLREKLQDFAGNDVTKKAGCVLNFFDVYDSEARRVLLELPLDGKESAKMIRERFMW